MPKTIYTKDPARFYVYAFLREDTTPYYIGKGTGNRAWGKRRRISPPTDSRISILFENLTETEAFTEEIRLIQFYGRKDLGTGILRNLTDGGEGASGCIRSQDTLDKMSEAKSGENHPMYGKKATPETLAKQSAAKTGENNHMYGKTGENNHMYGKTGENNPMYGKRHTQDALDKMSGENHPMYGKVPSEETKNKRLATRKRNKEAKSILSLVEENS